MDQNDEIIFESWFLKRNLSEKSQLLYRKAIKFYIQLTGLSLNELKNEAKKEEQENIWVNDRKIQIHLLRFKKYLEETNRAPNTRNSYFNAVRSFYRSQGIQIPEIIMPKGDICLEENYTKLLTKNDIQKMIDASKTRDRAIIYVMALSGMSQAEMRNLTIQKFLDSINKVNPEIETLKDLFKYEKNLKNTIITLHITRKKENIRFHTFLPPESIYSIIAYLRERYYGKNKHIKITDTQTPIFVTHSGRKLDAKAISSIFLGIGKKAGFKKNKKGALSFWRSHALRKYFTSTVIKNTGDHMFADYLTAHKIPDVKRAYWIVDPEDFKKRYTEVLPYLSIDEIKVKNLHTKEIENFLTESKEKENKMAEMIKKMEEMEKRNKTRDELLDKIVTERNLMEKVLEKENKK